MRMLTTSEPAPGLAHGEAADMLARDQLRQVLALLQLAAVAADLVNAEVGVGAIGEADRGRAAAHLFHGHDMGEVTHIRAAMLFFDGDAVQPERAHLGPELTREFVGAVYLGGERRDLIVGKAADGVAQLIDLGAEIEIERWIAIGRHRRLPGVSPQSTGRLIRCKVKERAGICRRLHP
jgi:hypothetical protein